MGKSIARLWHDKSGDPTSVGKVLVIFLSIILAAAALYLVVSAFQGGYRDGIRNAYDAVLKR